MDSVARIFKRFLGERRTLRLDGLDCRRRSRGWGILVRELPVSQPIGETPNALR